MHKRNSHGSSFSHGLFFAIPYPKHPSNPINTKFGVILNGK
nr:MAG TPA: hypothetical protein [Caudoviricetes sp.]